jgi:hypothetical protein
LLRQAIAQANNEFVSPDEILAEQGINRAQLDG